MPSLRLALFLSLATAPLLVGPAAAAEVKVGDKIANLAFTDTRYLPRSLEDFKDRKAFVLVFTTTGCPVVQRYLPTLQKLETEYRGKGVQFVAVNVGPDDSIRDLAAQQVEHGMEFPFVKDFDHSCARKLGVQRTPTAVVLDAKRTLRYRGRIDDRYRLGGARDQATRNDLREAIDAVLAGKEVAVKETTVDGCAITPPPELKPVSKLTFAKDVAPILKKHCQDCHRPGTAAPFSLITYEQVAAKANTVAEVVAEGRMPPWYAASSHGEFVNRRGLTAAERDTLRAWVKAGKPRGDEAKLPKPPPDAGEKAKWLIGEPDLVLQAPEHSLPAEGDIAYKYEVLKHVFTEDTWVQGVQILPSNPRVVHHCNMIYALVKEGFKGFKQSNFITGQVPGGSPMKLDNGIAFRIPAGSVLALQIHYVSTGKPEKCRISVGVRYAREPIQKQLRHVLLDDYRFAIPPGAPAHEVKSSKVLDRDAVGLALFSHMHLRGRDMTFRAYYPDGKSETLLLVPNYSFDWQMPYVWAQGKKRFPKGTRLEAVAHYDNSDFNPYNPDPKKKVTFGQQTRDEMMNGYFFYTDANEKLNLQIDPKTGHVTK